MDMDWSMVLNEVLCVSSAPPDVVVTHDGAVKASDMYRCAAMQLQVLLNHAWEALFGVPPTPKDVRELLSFACKCQGAVAHAIVRAYVVDKTFIKFLPTLSQQEQQLGLLLTPIADSLPDASRSRASVLQRWASKYPDVHVNIQEPLPTIAAALARRRQQDEVKTALVNPVTQISFEHTRDERDADMSRAEALRYAMTHDTFFHCHRALTTTAVVCTSATDACLALAMRILERITDAPQRCLVLVLADRDIPDTETSELAAKWDTHRVDAVVYANMPRIFPRCICIQDPASTSTVPRSLCRDAVASILVRQGRQECLPPAAGYGRAVTLLAEDGFNGLDGLKRPNGLDGTRVLTHDARQLCLPAAPVSVEWAQDCVNKLISRFLHVQGIHPGEAAYLNYIVTRCLQTRFFSSMSSTITTRPDSQQCIVAIENRKNPHTVFALLNTLAFLQADRWRVVIVCAPAVAAYYQRALPAHTEVIQDMPCMQYVKFDIEDYNTLLKGPAVWTALAQRGIERALVVQDDGMLVRPGLDACLETFCHWDYVGAPWADAPANEPLKVATQGRMAGNGGLSLRSVPAMLAAQARRESTLFFTQVQTEPEDVFYSTALAKTCPSEIAQLFASEQVLYSKSLGFHKPWPYHDAAAVRQFFDDALYA